MAQHAHLSRSAGIVVVLLAASAAGAGPLEMPFESNPARGAILLKGSVNGKEANFLLDTGAARTVLSAEIMQVHPTELKMAKFADDGPGLHGEAMWAVASLRLSGRLWADRTIVVMNLQPVSKVYGRRIDGIIGQDLLTEFSRVTIDFKRKRVVFEE